MHFIKKKVLLQNKKVPFPKKKKSHNKIKYAAAKRAKIKSLEREDPFLLQAPPLGGPGTGVQGNKAGAHLDAAGSREQALSKSVAL